MLNERLQSNAKFKGAKHPIHITQMPCYLLETAIPFLPYIVSVYSLIISESTTLSRYVISQIVVGSIFPQTLRVVTSLIRALASASIPSIKRLILTESRPRIKSLRRKNLLDQIAYLNHTTLHNSRTLLAVCE